jgi:hypothetical protein
MSDLRVPSSQPSVDTSRHVSEDDDESEYITPRTSSPALPPRQARLSIDARAAMAQVSKSSPLISPKLSPAAPRKPKPSLLDLAHVCAVDDV